MLLNLLVCALAVEAAVLRPSASIEKRQSTNGLSGLLNLFGGSFKKTNIPLVSAFIPLLPSGAQTARRTLMQPVRSEDFKPQRFPKAKRKQVTWGPFQLQPVKAKHLIAQGGIKLDMNSDVFEEPLSGLCQNCMLLDIHFDVSDKFGNHLLPKDEVYTHHMILGSYGKDTPPTALRMTNLCGNDKGGSRLPKALPSMEEFKSGIPFQGAGPKGLPFTPGNIGDMLSSFMNSKLILVKGPEQNEINFMSTDGKIPKSGVWIDTQEKLLISAEVVNYKSEAQDIYFTADIEYQEFDTKPTSYLRTDLTTFIGVDCENLLMHPPADKPVNYESPEYTVEKPMYLINLNPHLHDGATNMRILVNGTLACDATVKYGRSGGLTVNGKEWETISTTTPCETIKLSPGDKVKMTSEFDLSKHQLRPSSANHEMGAEAMAIGFIQFAYPE